MPFGSPHRHSAQCASTSDLAKEWAADNTDPAPHGALVSADFQTRGRGRRGRQWQAQPGESVLMSVVLRPAFAPADAWQLGFVAALAVSDALLIHTHDVTLKWPNDVLIAGNKAAGILVETVSPPHGWAAIVGIGINVCQHEFPSSDTYAVPPTSLLLAAGHAPPLAALTRQVTSALQQRLAQHAEGGWPASRADWRARMARDILLQRGPDRGIVVDLEPDGQALIHLGNGTFTHWATVEPEENANSGSNGV